MKNTIPGMCKNFLNRAGHSKPVFAAAAIVGLTGVVVFFVPVLSGGDKVCRRRLCFRWFVDRKQALFLYLKMSLPMPVSWHGFFIRKGIVDTLWKVGAVKNQAPREDVDFLA